MDEQEKYMCCFCGETIPRRGPDPCSLAFTINFTKPEDDQITEGFTCHYKCLEERLHTSVIPYFMGNFIPSLEDTAGRDK
jgi:hypothetical protein